jgi:hypothetical protein
MPGEVSAAGSRIGPLYWLVNGLTDVLEQALAPVAGMTW